MRRSPPENVQAAAGTSVPGDLRSLSDLETLQQRLEETELGIQSIQGHFYAAFGENELKLPRSFTFVGQRFTMDSWALNQVTFPRVPYLEVDNQLQWRRIPSGLDVAFSVFANNHSVPLLAERMSNRNGMQFRDGFPYQPWLAAVRNTIDSGNAEMWDDSLYTIWLGALRSLSIETTGTEFPEAMRTRAWAMKTLNTQLGSWTQLRHDT